MPAPRPQDVRRLLPLKPIVFYVLLTLLDEECHGYLIVKQVERRIADGRKILPGNLYRTLRGMLGQGLIEESDERPDPDLDDERRRYYRITDLGSAVARAEARRLEGMVSAARERDLLSSPRG